MVSDTNHQPASLTSTAETPENPRSHPEKASAPSSVSSVQGIQNQFAIMKQLLRDQLDNCREQVSLLEEQERKNEQIRIEKEVQRDEMKNFLHGALEAQKELSAVSSEMAKSEVLEENHYVQMADIKAHLEGNVNYKRQKQEELKETLQTRS
ncbi:uncharacterized protein C8R40DRAFT_1072904 [Lentinula edodes]|uniref:uncharacterized protein n=1 Tax=Lentinula edodes TaxID=5353 RepID=UPI001E8CB4A1|nr:uncharacterized protein C8R40DRAFT_1072904 [Lentinula edodes]KAH7870902.1 hypothetical protein C8R40DRAFT_1072904 [Lentinula edodes]